ncbi:MAG: hypothetical protein R3B70_00565 [Polyangiaceae bacterium]
MALSISSRSRLSRAAVAAFFAAGLALSASPASAAKTKVLDLDFEGTFELDLPTLELSFDGEGQNPHLGLSSLEGESSFAPISPLCLQIVEDGVTITAADGSTIELDNSGVECLDFSTGAPRIVGGGVSAVLGGTGRFAGIGGEGTYHVDAAIETNDGITAGGTVVLHFTLTTRK